MKKNKFFLWNFIIDCQYQNRGIGKKFLIYIINILKKDYNASIITTTYKYDNNIAKRLYENIGFKQLDIINKENIHEVNMILHI